MSNWTTQSPPRAGIYLLRKSSKPEDQRRVAVSSSLQGDPHSEWPEWADVVFFGDDTEEPFELESFVSADFEWLYEGPLLDPRSDWKIYVNVWDDSPPGAPVYIEGAPDHVDKDKVLDQLLQAAKQEGYRVKGHKIQHPTIGEWDGTLESETAHFAFLDKIVALFEKQGHWIDNGGTQVPLSVYSES